MCFDPLGTDMVALLACLLSLSYYTDGSLAGTLAPLLYLKSRRDRFHSLERIVVYSL